MIRCVLTIQQVNGALIPKAGKWRPDFEAPGPHVTVEKLRGATLSEVTSREPGDEEYEDDDFTSYRYYESKKILGKLYRNIDERGIFEKIKKYASPAAMSGSTVIKAVWDYVQDKCRLIEWNYKLDWARDTRDMYAKDP